MVSCLLLCCALVSFIDIFKQKSKRKEKAYTEAGISQEMQLIERAVERKASRSSDIDSLRTFVGVLYVKFDLGMKEREEGKYGFVVLQESESLGFDGALVNEN